MKKLILWVVIAVSVFFGSCVSLNDKVMAPEEKQTASVLGTVNAQFLTINLLHLYNAESLKLKAYDKLLASAKKEYGEGVRVVNVNIKGTLSFWELIPVVAPGTLVFAPAWVNVQKIFVTGDVVSIGNSASLVNQQRLSKALQAVCDTLIEKIPDNSIIAILSVSSYDNGVSETVIDELEYNLVNSGKFTIVDRRRLDQIRTEQNFQMSGDVDDNSAVSIGNMLGANIVLTGNLTKSGAAQIINIKALDVKTARIISMAREQF